MRMKLATGKAVAVEEGQPAGAKVLDFMEALKRSVSTGKSGGEEPRAKPAAAKPRASRPAPVKRSGPKEAPGKSAPAEKRKPAKRSA